MSNNARRAKTAAAAAVLLTALGAGSAQAYVGGPGSGPLTNSDGPDLISAEIREVIFADGASEIARFCFDTNVSVNDASGFRISGYDADQRWTSIAANSGVNPDPQNCVDAEFESDSNLHEGTVAYVENDAILENGNQGQGNPIASVPLQGAEGIDDEFGGTTGPDLVSATVNPTQNSVNYCFDERIDEFQGLNENDFEVVSAGGGEMNGLSAAVSDDNCVRAIFPDPSDGNNDANEFNVRSAVQATVDPGAVVEETAGASVVTASSRGSVKPNGKASSRTSRPDLLSAVRKNARQFVLTFDQDVDNYDADEVDVVTDDGQEIEAESLRRQTTQNQALATFPDDIEDLTDGELVRIAVDDGAVEDSEVEPQDKLENTEGAVGIDNAGEAAGHTTAPDLLSATFDDTSNEVEATFDEDLGDVNENDVELLRASGIQEDALSTALVDDNTLLVQYPVSADAAIGMIVRNRGVDDDGGQPAGDEDSTPMSVGVGVAPVTSAPVAPTQPEKDAPAAPAAPQQPVGPAKESPKSDPITTPATNPAVTVGSSAKATPKLRTGVRAVKVKGKVVRGKVTGAGGCRSGRVVTVLSAGKVIGKGKTKADGSFVIKVKKAVKKATVKVAETSTCSAK